jgi:hypothetical protein
MAKPSNRKESHLDENRPATLDGLDENSFVTYTANTNDTLSGVRISGTKVTLFWTRSVRNNTNGEVLMQDTVRESHDLRNVGDLLIKNISVMVAASKIGGGASLTRSGFFGTKDS